MKLRIKLKANNGVLMPAFDFNLDIEALSWIDRDAVEELEFEIIHGDEK